MWKRYNGALISTAAPHETIEATFTAAFWKKHRRELFARWTSDYDCKQETAFWYIVKDTPFDIGALKAKRRYEINKGNRNFEVREIVPAEYAEELFAVTQKAYEAYPAKSRPRVEHDSFVFGVKQGAYYKTYGAFDKETAVLCGYALLRRDGQYVNLCVLKTDPQAEAGGVNAAIVYRVLEEHREFLQTGGYICDGARNVLHRTAFQEYLIKYFEFRKAYCKLNIAYNPRIKWIIPLLYPMRNVLKKIKSNRLASKVYGVLLMEEIARDCAKVMDNE